MDYIEDEKIISRAGVMDYLHLNPKERLLMARVPEVLDEINKLIDENKELHNRLQSGGKSGKGTKTNKKSVSRVCLKSGKVTLYKSFNEAMRKTGLDYGDIMSNIAMKGSKDYRWDMVAPVLECIDCGIRGFATELFGKNGKKDGVQTYVSQCKPCRSKYMKKLSDQRKQKKANHVL